MVVVVLSIDVDDDDDDDWWFQYFLLFFLGSATAIPSFVAILHYCKGANASFVYKPCTEFYLVCQVKASVCDGH